MKQHKVITYCWIEYFDYTRLLYCSRLDRTLCNKMKWSLILVFSFMFGPPSYKFCIPITAHYYYIFLQLIWNLVINCVRMRRVIVRSLNGAPACMSSPHKNFICSRCKQNLFNDNIISLIKLRLAFLGLTLYFYHIWFSTLEIGVLFGKALLLNSWNCNKRR